jgi:hypothetical protein
MYARPDLHWVHSIDKTGLYPEHAADEMRDMPHWI